nr:MAG TPA: hypothetical protein [Caudoviricetes sp.]
MLIIVALQHQIEKCRAGNRIGFLVICAHVKSKFVVHGRMARCVSNQLVARIGKGLRARHLACHTVRIHGGAGRGFEAVGHRPFAIGQGNCHASQSAVGQGIFDGEHHSRAVINAFMPFGAHFAAQSVNRHKLNGGVVFGDFFGLGCGSRLRSGGGLRRWNRGWLRCGRGLWSRLRRRLGG